ncbi:MAG: NAD(P)H-hydrate dehydratase [Desulfovibrio sp.]|nr:NAD(P)H-hydrate dehydratase [Desulfovibrio sp.]
MSPDSFLACLPILACPETTRLMDKKAIDFGIPELMLMENAARAALDLLEQKWGAPTGVRIWLFMGSGNNGGDAAALARNLADRGAIPTLFCLKAPDQYFGSPAVNLDLARRDNVEILRIDPVDAPAIFASRVLTAGAKPSIIIDGLLGTGFSGPLKPELEKLVAAINEFASLSGVRVMALDIPSGLDARTGRPSPIAIRADLTATFAADKPGLCIGREYAGEVYVREVGFPRVVREQIDADGLLLDGRAFLPFYVYPENSYKNIFGRVLIVGGQPGMGGAACLAALSALRAGAGLVTVCAPSATVAQARNFAPEIMTMDLGLEWPGAIPVNLAAEIASADALVIGPGMGEKADALLHELLSVKNRPPAVIDADALKIIGREPSFRQYVRVDDILTPHPGEAAALLGIEHVAIQEDRPAALAAILDTYRAVCVLKGAYTLVGAPGEPFVLCPYDLPSLAIAGAGDVLAGCAGGFLAGRDRGSSLAIAAKAVGLHALAGVMLSAQFPGRGLLAGELAKALPHIAAWLRSLDKILLDKGLAPWPSSN